MTISPPAPMATAADLLKMPGLMSLFVDAFNGATGKTMEEDAAVALAAVINAWPDANKAYFAQGPVLMLPMPKP